MSVRAVGIMSGKPSIIGLPLVLLLILVRIMAAMPGDVALNEHANRPSIRNIVLLTSTVASVVQRQTLLCSGNMQVDSSEFITLMRISRRLNGSTLETARGTAIVIVIMSARTIGNEP
jgi:hypothetical protein